MQRKVVASFEVVPAQRDTSQLRANVERQLPLTSLLWKPANRQARTIAAVDLELRQLDTAALAAASTSTPLFERPFLHLLFVVCDDNDVYRGTLRPQIRQWLDQVTERPNHEWLIVHVTATRTAGSKFIRKGTVLDKMRADWNSGKRDRCVQVPSVPSKDDVTAWAEFTAKMKEGIVATFDANVSLYEDDVRRADSQRQLPGWNYLTFFLQKEDLAESFEAMGLVDDALIQYEELEASFFQTMKDGDLSCFGGGLGGLAPGDDVKPILSTTKKPYRHLISTNAVSVFDFRVYLFARQANLLLRLGRIAEAARRGAYFVSTFARTLRQGHAALRGHFLDSWTYCSCMNLVESCYAAMRERNALHEFSAVESHLLELARKQLDKVGLSVGFLPRRQPFVMSLNEEQRDDDGATQKAPVTNDKLLEAMKSQEHFDRLYIDITNRAIRAYQACGRHRSALKLHASLAALQDHRGRQESAQHLYSLLLAHYVESRWIRIEGTLLASCARLQETAGLEKEQLLTTLALLRSGVEPGARAWRIDPSVLEALGMPQGSSSSDVATRLMDNVYRLAKPFEKDFAANAFPAFRTSLPSEHGRPSEDEDGVVVILRLTNLLPCPVAAQDVRLKFANADGEHFWFTSGRTSLQSGDNDVALFCPTPLIGCIALELAQIRYSHIIFQYSYRPGPSAVGPQPSVYFRHDRKAINLYAEIPSEVHLDGGQKMELCLASGRSALASATIRLSGVHEPATFFYEEAQLLSEGVEMQAASSTLNFARVPPATTVRVSVPFRCATDGLSSIDLSLLVEYSSERRPHARRTLRRVAHFPLSLPLMVNVSDLFHARRLSSRFTISTDGYHDLWLFSVRLEGSDGATLPSCRRRQHPFLLSRKSQSSFLYRLPAAHSGAMKLIVKYITVDEHLTRVVGSAAREVLDEAVSTDERARIEASALRRLLRDRYPQINATQSLEDRVFALASQQRESVPAQWRTLCIPVDTPSVDLLCLVRWDTLGSQNAEVGDCVRATFTIRTTSALRESPGLSYVVEEGKDWLLDGSGKGTVELGGGQHSAQVVLIPLRPGRLLLPSVTVFSKNTSACATHMDTVETVSVFPAHTTSSIFELQ